VTARIMMTAHIKQMSCG